MRILGEQDRSYIHDLRNEIDAVKEKMCSVALNYEAEMRNKVRKTYELPDGRVVTVAQECFQCPEPLFQPQLLNIDSVGIHEICNNSIKRCDEDIHTRISTVTLSSLEVTRSSLGLLSAWQRRLKCRADYHRKFESLHQILLKGSTPCGEEGPLWLHFLLFQIFGFQKPSMMRQAHPSCTASVSRNS